MSSHAPEYGTAWWLTVRKGPQAGTVYPLRGHILTIGRQPDNYIVIDDPMISRHHARFTLQSDSYVLTDLGSANGTWVNDVRLAGPALLRPGDVIGLGRDVLLVFSNRPDYGTANEVPASDVTLYAAVPGAVQPTAVPGAMHSASVAGATPKKRGFPGWLAAVLGIVMAAMAIAIGAIVLIQMRGTPEPEIAVVTSTPTVTSAPTYTPYPTYTPIPTDTPIPTSAPTYTPYPTYTPIPTLPPTYTPYPTYTSIPTSPPTYTPYPTYTPLPTPKPTRRPPSVPQPTDTPVPTDTPKPPPFTVAINKIEPEPWGRPTNPDGCNGPYNDRDPVKRFTIEIILYNQSDRYIPDGWYPLFHSAKGDAPPTCVWYYDNTAVQPGETIYVTFATHVELDDWVQNMVLDELGYELVVCFNPAGQVVACR
jgi:hypothetical protein